MRKRKVKFPATVLEEAFRSREQLLRWLVNRAVPALTAGSGLPGPVRLWDDNGNVWDVELVVRARRVVPKKEEER